MRWLNENKLVLIFISFYFLISIIKIEHPGVNNDQLMFINAATLKEDSTFIWKSFHGIPIMVFPYIGALKSYIYTPIFYLFGVNIWSIRLPQIILISISWFILYKTLLIAFDKKLALLTILFLSFDPSIIAYSKVDQGPTVLEFFLKVLAVYLLFNYIKQKKSIYFLAIFPTLALGIFNKLNFIWFTNAFMISFIIFYGRNFYEDFKRRFDKLFPFLILVIPYFFLLKLFLKISREVSLSYKSFYDPVSLSNLFTNSLVFQKNLVELINGNIFFNVLYGYNPTPFGTYFSILILMTLFIGGYLLIKQKAPRAYYFFISLIILMIFQILLTKQAIFPWHVLSIFPFFTIILAAAVIKIRKFSPILICSIIFYLALINFFYITKYGTPTKSIAYSGTIYDLIDFAKNTNKKFICLDVDICNQLLSLNQQKGKYKEPFGFLDEQTYNDSFIKLNENFKNPNGFLYVDHSDTNSHFPNFRKRFFNYLKENDINYKKIKQFNDGEVVAYEIYKIGNF